MSGVMHGVLLLAFGLLVRFTPRGVAPEADRAGSIVLVNNAQGEAEYFSEDDALVESEMAAAASSSDSPAAAGEMLPQASEVEIDFAGVLPAAGDIAGGLGEIGDALPDATSLLADGLNGRLPTQGLGKPAQTQVFGLQGEGSKFVYVFDRSGSMEGYGGRPIAAAKSELIASLEPLESTHQFQIIFYNEKPFVFNPLGTQRPRLMFGSDRDKEMAQDFVGRVLASGGTRHMEPLRLALNLAPDVIFFLTDADEPRLTDVELEQIRRWNKADAVINAIQFGSGPFDGENNFLVKLATQNRGQHVYIDVSKLPKVGRRR